ncbi:hypothetical protein C8R45DRAFT_1032889 [Mycena sanguinolenta]|nr:hypothetical protein C8R45DRAFT_1035600 [Mycena sanguinolenta]KAJ6457224.1 hypothetical protein C8R45DRAFT_1032974 [Mycena sanguinolenta]KAJ6457715.1 hypothetical protein C8R45DRAFT_1032889 [Mycena sanguinolenta]
MLSLFLIIADRLTHGQTATSHPSSSCAAVLHAHSNNKTKIPPRPSSWTAYARVAAGFSSSTLGSRRCLFRYHP